MAKWKLFYRLMVRPLGKERARTGLTILAVALGVAVVLAIQLAGEAATGSFHTSMETLAGNSQLEVTAVGGVPEEIVGKLATLPFPIEVSPRVEGTALIAETKRSVPLVGIDVVAEGEKLFEGENSEKANEDSETSKTFLRALGDRKSIWIGESLGHKAGDRLDLVINDREKTYTVQGTFPDNGGNEEAIVIDIEVAQRALGRTGRVDRILLKVPERPGAEEWRKRVEEILPAGIAVRATGTATEENRKMLAAFRWNLELLSTIALAVGAFLIYNTISVSVVRRRADIGIVRALGASRSAVLGAFMGEAAVIGLAGAVLGVPLGRVMATGAVRLMGATVNALYVSSRPGAIALSASAVLLALGIGIGIAVVSAYSPAREAALIPPAEAMARGRREYLFRVHKMRDLLIAVILAASAAAASRGPAIGGKPVLGYVAALLVISAMVLAIPAFVDATTRICTSWLRKLYGVEAALASRSLGASLRRTSVLVGALCTAVGMMTAVGIMVGSFRETVVQWMGSELPADLYIRPAGAPGAERHPTISPELAEKIAHVEGVEAVEGLRAYEISYEGMPAELLGADLKNPELHHESDLLSGRPTPEVLRELRGTNTVIVSEPFANKHHVKAGDTIHVAMGEKVESFRVADVCYDYSSERGYILMDRGVMLRYLPDPAPSNLAVYVEPGFDAASVREELQRVSANYRVLIFSNRDLRAQAIKIFDQTFAITYALEAIAVLVAVMGVAGALLALVIDRKREMGLLRYLGAAGRQIRKIILAEAALLGLLANAAGVALGFLLSLILIFVINKQSFGWTIQFHWPVAVLLGALAVVYAATVVAGFYPARVAVRMNPLEAVHEE